jgi:hypothetical protein
MDSRGWNASLPADLVEYKEYLPDPLSRGSNGSAEAQLSAAPLSDPHVPASLDLKAAADHLNVISIVMLVSGTLIAAAPSQFLQAAVNTAPNMLERTFAQLMGIALIYRGLIARVLKGAAERNRLGSTTSQRVMLGCLLPALAHVIVFNSAWKSWGTSWNPIMMSLYPAIILAEFATYISTFQAYNPYFLLKLFWPMAVGYFISQLLPIPPVNLDALPSALSPVTAGLAVVLGQRGVQILGKGVVMSLKVGRKAFVRYFRKKVGAQTLHALVPEAGE